MINEKTKKEFSCVRIVKLSIALFVCIVSFIGIYAFADEDIKYINPKTKVGFYRIDDMLEARHSFSAIKLMDGNVFISGGVIKPRKNKDGVFVRTTNSTEIFDSATRKFKKGPDLMYAREGHKSALLPNGLVLIYGDKTNTTEIYNPYDNTIKEGALLKGDNYLYFIYKNRTVPNANFFLDDEQNYLYIGDAGSQLYDIKNNETYLISIKTEWNQGTDTIIGFKDKKLEKEFITKIKNRYKPYHDIYKNISKKHYTPVKYNNDLFYIIGLWEYENDATDTISLYDNKNKTEKIINSKMSCIRVFPKIQQINKDKVLIWGKNILTLHSLIDILDMKTQKVEHLGIYTPSRANRTIELDDGNILWLGGIESGSYPTNKAYIFKYGENVNYP